MLTVFFATRNGARTLPQVLEAYRELVSPVGGWRLVVIDNGSTDGTEALLDGFRSHLPLTVLGEPTPGKNRALNTGLGEMAGDLAVFTDDDVFPNRDWLTALRAAADAHPDYSVFGGTVLPRWESPPPPWVLDWVPLGPTFTLTGELPEGPTGPHTVFGPNMAIRGDVFSRGTRFDATIGPRGPSYAMGSETELIRRLLREGHRAWHAAGARVEHFIRRHQLTRSWILGRAVRFGRGQYHLEPETGGPRWAGVPRWMARDLVRQVLTVAARAMTVDARRLFQAQWDLRYRWGQIIEARTLGGAS